MNIPNPESGLVINYSYLWSQEALTGLEEGLKNRPCAVVLATEGNIVIVAPITHTPPIGSDAIEIPPQIKKRLGLDHEKSWLITSEVNYFKWPGPDLRPISRQQSDQMVYGKLPPGITSQIKREVQSNARARSLSQVNRDSPSKEPPAQKKTTRQKVREQMERKRQQSRDRSR